MKNGPNTKDFRGKSTMKVFAAALGCAIFLASPAPAETLNNASVIQLVKVGLGPDAVVAKIRSTPNKFDLGVDDLIALKNAGVPSDVITAMMGGGSDSRSGSVAAMSVTDVNPMVPHPSGLYLINSQSNRLNRIDPTVSSQAKTGGIIGYALTGGIASMSVKVAISGASARVGASANPSFYFFFDASNPATANIASNWAAGSAQTVSSPSEFTLIRLMEKKGRREARVGSQNIVGAKTGVMDHDRVPFDYEMIREGVYRVYPKQPLEPGQYGFIYALTGGGTGGAMTARIFDFAVPNASLASQ